MLVLSESVRFVGKKGGGKPNVALTEEEMTEVVDLNRMKEQMANMIVQLQEDLVQKLSLRTNIGKLHVHVWTHVVRTFIVSYIYMCEHM